MMGALVVVPERRKKQYKRDPLGYSVESTTICLHLFSHISHIVQLLQCCLGRYRFSSKLNGIIDSHQHV